MKNHFSGNHSKGILRLMVFCAVLCGFVAAPLLSSATPQSDSITIVNNSGQEIEHVYFSPADSDNWGPDQLNDAAIAPGGSRTLTIASDQSQVKVITEDKDGCFLSKVVSSSGSSTWTITNSDAPNCGGGY